MNLILCDFIRRTADLNTVDDISKHALGAAIERTRKLHHWRDPDLVSAGDELDVIYHVVTERLLGELGSIARRNPKLKHEKFWKKYHIEQIYLSAQIQDQVFWPTEWCKSFKHNLLPRWPFRIWKPAKLPKDTSIVAFTVLVSSPINS